MTAIDLSELELPERIRSWIGDAPLFESSGASGASTLFIDGKCKAYLKIASYGALRRAYEMQKLWHSLGLSSEVLLYASLDRDYLITAAINGESGIHPHYLAEPERLSRVFGEALRSLHELRVGAPPMPMAETTESPLSQTHLELLTPFIGNINAETARHELQANLNLLQSDVLVHGDYCLPNIVLSDWHLTGYIDIADSGMGDRHHDLVWGLWSLQYNLNDARCGELFLDAYGRDVVDPQRLRLCGLLSALP